MRKGAAARCKPCSQVIVITSKCRVWPNPSPATRTPSPCIASKVVLLPSLRPNQTQPSHRTSHSRRPLYDHASALAGPSTLPKRHQQPLSPRFALPRWGKTTFVKRTRLKSRHTGSLGCAPTPSQYLVRLVSSWIFLYRFCSGRGRSVSWLSTVSGVSVARGTRGTGS